MKPMINSLKTQIQMYIKNKNDISELIKDIDIKGQDFSYAVIKYLNRVNCDLRGTNFSHCLLGCDDKIFTLIQCNISNSNFEYAQFVGTSFIRSCVAHNCNFKGADVSKVSYEHTDFGQTSNFCGAKITISTNSGIGCHFPKKMFYDLMKGWNTKFKIVDDNKESGD